MPADQAGRGIDATIDLRTYSLDAVKRTAYRVAERCTVVLGDRQGDSLALTFMFRPSTTEHAASEAVRSFYQELLDESLRDELRNKTDALRSLIMAHTFSRTDLIKRS